MLTPQQIEAIRTRTGIKPVAQPVVSSAASELDTAWGNVSTPEVPKRKLADDFAKESIENTVNGYKEIDDLYHSGQIGIGEMALHKVGNTIGGITDFLASPFKAIGPQNKKTENTELPPLQQKIANALADPKIATYENAGKLAKEAGDLMVQAHKETDPEKRKKIIALADEISNTAKQVQSKANEIDQDLALASRRADTTLQVGGALLGAEAPVGEVTAEAGATASAIAKTAKPVINAGREVLAGQAEKRALQSGIKAIDEATEIGRSPITEQMEKEAFKRGDITQSKILGKRTVAPSVADKRIGEALEPLVSDGRVSSKNPLESGRNIKEEVDRINIGVKELLKDPKYNQPFNMSQLDKQIGRIKSDNQILFGGDKSIEAAYDTVINEFKKFVKTKDASGLFDARQEFDSFIKGKYPDIFKKDKFGNINPADNAKKNAVYDLRRSVNEYVADLVDTSNNARTLRAISPKESQTLVAKAKNFKKEADFVNNQRDVFREKVLKDVSYRAEKRRIDKWIEKGLTVDESFRKEGIDIAFDSDLKDIWQMAHTEVNSTAGKAFMAGLRKETDLMRALENIAEKQIVGTTDTNAIQRLLNDHPWLKAALPTGVVTSLVTGAVLSR